MMNPLPVSARRLCHRDLQAADGPVRDVCLFPFFDRSGWVKHVMLLPAESTRIHVLRWHEGLFRVPMWAPIRSSASFVGLRPITEADADLLGALWHFDPWWMLDQPAYAGHWAVPTLKATNCADQLAQTHRIRMVYFRRHLGRLSGVIIRGPGKIQYAGWKADYPPAKESTPVHKHIGTVHAKPRWRLDPMWTRGLRDQWR